MQQNARHQGNDSDTLTVLIQNQIDDWFDLQDDGQSLNSAEMHITLYWGQGTDVPPAGELVIRPLFDTESNLLQVEVRDNSTPSHVDTKVTGMCPLPATSIWSLIGKSEGFALGVQRSQR